MANSVFNNDLIFLKLDKPQIDQLVKELPGFVSGRWKHLTKLSFLYEGNPQAKLTIPYTVDSWRSGYLGFGGINTVTPINGFSLTEAERMMLVEEFYKEVLVPYVAIHSDIKIIRNEF